MLQRRITNIGDKCSFYSTLRQYCYGGQYPQYVQETIGKITGTTAVQTPSSI